MGKLHSHLPLPCVNTVVIPNPHQRSLCAILITAILTRWGWSQNETTINKYTDFSHVLSPQILLADSFVTATAIRCMDIFSHSWLFFKTRYKCQMSINKTAYNHKALPTKSMLLILVSHTIHLFTYLKHSRDALDIPIF